LVQDLTAASASAAGGGNDSSSDDEDDATTWTYCTQQDTASYAALLFDRGAQQGVKARNREALYSISKDLERVAGKRRKAAADAAAVPLGKQTQQKEQQQQQLEQLGRQAKKHKQPAKQQQGQQVEPTEVVANGDAEPPSGKKQRKQAQLQQQQQQQAEQAAAAAAAAAATPGTVGKRKKQKKQAADAKHAALSAAAGVANGSASPGKRGVKIDLKKNLYFEHGAPPPAADVRTPPKAKPKGSALKSAVKLDSSGRPTVPATAPAGGQQQQGARRKLVTPSSVPRLRAAEFF
jgi:ribosomal RNA-processing protein 1